MYNVPIYYGVIIIIHSVSLLWKLFKKNPKSSLIFHILFQNEDGVEVTDEDILTEIHHLTMAVKAAQFDDYPESHIISYVDT